MRFTRYFLRTRQRPDRLRIRFEWIEAAVDHPAAQEIQHDGRIRRRVYVPEEARYLRVILLADGVTVHNAFFDRGFSP